MKKSGTNITDCVISIIHETAKDTATKHSRRRKDPCYFAIDRNYRNFSINPGSDRSLGVLRGR
jgi:hypothetical protein